MSKSLIITIFVVASVILSKSFAQSSAAPTKSLDSAIYKINPAGDYTPMETDLPEEDVKFFNENRCKIYPDTDKPNDLDAAKADDKSACEKKIGILTKAHESSKAPSLRGAYVFTLVNNYYYLSLVLENERKELSEPLPRGYRSVYFVSGDVIAYDPAKKSIILSGYAEAYHHGVSPAPKDLTSSHPDPKVFNSPLPITRFLSQDVTPVRAPSYIGIVHSKSSAKPKQKLRLYGLHFVNSDVIGTGESIFIFTPVVPPNFADRIKSLAALDKQLLGNYAQMQKFYSEYQFIDRHGIPRSN